MIYVVTCKPATKHLHHCMCWIYLNWMPICHNNSFRSTSNPCRRCRHSDCRSDCRRGHCACDPVLLQPSGKFETLSKGLIVSHQRNKQKLNPVIDIHVIKKFYLPSNCKYIPNLKFIIKPSWTRETESHPGRPWPTLLWFFFQRGSSWSSRETLE